MTNEPAENEGPARISVVVGYMSEPELMAALEQVVMHWLNSWQLPEAHTQSVPRAVRWLHDKYGPAGFNREIKK